VTLVQGLESELVRLDFFCEVEVREEVWAKESGRSKVKERSRAIRESSFFISLD